jgi:RIO kinase 1
MKDGQHRRVAGGVVRPPSPRGRSVAELARHAPRPPSGAAFFVPGGGIPTEVYVRPRYDDDDYDDHHDREPRRHDDWFDELFSEGLLTDVVRPLRSGKEASVYLCSATQPGAHALLAAKVYHPRHARAFRNDAVYKHGRVILNGHDRRAVARGTAYGQHLEEGMWIEREWDHLARAHELGADVPVPVAKSGRTILMEYIGDEDGPAPQLKDICPSPEEAGAMFERIRWNIEVLLSGNLVHADLSAYNVLVREGRPVIIDLPQAVDARTNLNSRALLVRDLENVCRFFERLRVRRDPHRIADDLWTRYLFADLRVDTAPTIR